MQKPKKIGILGAGGWGTGLSIVLHNNQHIVSMWEFDKEIAEKFKTTGENEKFLPGIKIPLEISIVCDLEEAVNKNEIILFAVPSHVVREVAEKIKELNIKDKIIISAVKGVENKSLYRMSEVLNEVLPDIGYDKIAVISGPSHAEEVSRKIPTAVTIASKSSKLAIQLQKIFMNPFFRVYASEDLIGVELGGSLKNIIAIAAGICDGADLGDNTKAALLTRGIAEITRLGVALGAEPKTFSGLAGIGDLIVTCYSSHSRNRFVGEQIGKGNKLSDVLKNMVMVAEGVKTTESVYQLSKKHNIETPIIEKVYNVLFNNENPKNAVYELMTREAKIEDWKIRKSRIF
ncbi:NAD(P)H-dependent glycerol-3-phosphate dehydrogenase [candidate division KSB1 bacterium]